MTPNLFGHRVVAGAQHLGSIRVDVIADVDVVEVAAVVVVVSVVPTI